MGRRKVRREAMSQVGGLPGVRPARVLMRAARACVVARAACRRHACTRVCRVIVRGHMCTKGTRVGWQIAD